MSSVSLPVPSCVTIGPRPPPHLHPACLFHPSFPAQCQNIPIASWTLISECLLCEDAPRNMLQRGPIWSTCVVRRQVQRKAQLSICSAYRTSLHLTLSLTSRKGSPSFVDVHASLVTVPQIVTPTLKRDSECCCCAAIDPSFLLTCVANSGWKHKS